MTKSDMVSFNKNDIIFLCIMGKWRNSMNGINNTRFHWILYAPLPLVHLTSYHWPVAIYLLQRSFLAWLPEMPGAESWTFCMASVKNLLGGGRHMLMLGLPISRWRLEISQYSKWHTKAITSLEKITALKGRLYGFIPYWGPSLPHTTLSPS